VFCESHVVLSDLDDEELKGKSRESRGEFVVEVVRRERQV
jgi:hypothetical protein